MKVIFVCRVDWQLLFKYQGVLKKESHALLQISSVMLWLWDVKLCGLEDWRNRRSYGSGLASLSSRTWLDEVCGDPFQLVTGPCYMG